MTETPSQAARRAGATGPEPVERSVIDVLRDRLTNSPRSAVEHFDRELNDRVFMAMLRPIAEHWFRLQVRGVENIPLHGAALLVGNHSGAIALDALMTQLAVFDHHPRHRHVHMLAADFVFDLPVLADIARAAGHTSASRDEAFHLLERGRLVGVWPEGLKGLGKTWHKRYELQHFGRGGFAATAALARVPIIPVAVVGAEEAYPMLADLAPLAKLLGLPYFPLTPTFPVLGLAGAVPLPSKWLIEFGEPIPPEALPDPYDERAVLAFAQEFRLRMQEQVDHLLAERGPAF